MHIVLRRAGLSRLGDLDGPTGLPIRYVRDRPGELIHVDVKNLSRLPPGGGWRVLGRAEGHKNRAKGRGLGQDFIHVAVDDATRLAYVAVFGDEKGDTCAEFINQAAVFFAAAGIDTIERVMTDNAKNYVLSGAFQAALAGLGARHKRTRPYRPPDQREGRAVQPHDDQRVAYAKTYRTNDERLAALPAWLEHYNTTRPHTGIGNRPPIDRVNNLLGNNS